MKTCVTVTASYADESVSVHFETDVTHRRGATLEEIQAKAVAKMRAYLNLHHEPASVAKLVNFTFSGVDATAS